jgi:hypothetical protein
MRRIRVVSVAAGMCATISGRRLGLTLLHDPHGNTIMLHRRYAPV